MKFLIHLHCTASLLALLFCSAVLASGGGMEGGGGTSVICRNSNGSIRTAEILDLYEGRVIYQLPYQESPKAWKDQALDIFKAASVRMDISSPPTEIYDWFR